MPETSDDERSFTVVMPDLKYEFVRGFVDFVYNILAMSFAPGQDFSVKPEVVEALGADLTALNLPRPPTDTVDLTNSDQEEEEEGQRSNEYPWIMEFKSGKAKKTIVSATGKVSYLISFQKGDEVRTTDGDKVKEALSIPVKPMPTVGKLIKDAEKSILDKEKSAEAMEKKDAGTEGEETESADGEMDVDEEDVTDKTIDKDQSDKDKIDEDKNVEEQKVDKPVAKKTTVDSKEDIDTKNVEQLFQDVMEEDVGTAIVNDEDGDDDMDVGETKLAVQPANKENVDEKEKDDEVLQDSPVKVEGEQARGEKEKNLIKKKFTFATPTVGGKPMKDAKAIVTVKPDGQKKVIVVVKPPDAKIGSTIANLPKSLLKNVDRVVTASSTEEARAAATVSASESAAASASAVLDPKPSTSGMATTTVKVAPEKVKKESKKSIKIKKKTVKCEHCDEKFENWGLLKVSLLKLSQKNYLNLTSSIAV